MTPTPRTALVTGVSRERGIGAAVAQQLLGEGARVFVQSWSAHDAQQPWGADRGGVERVLDGLAGEGDRLAHAEADLGDPNAPHRLVAAATERFGPLDVLVVNHAHSSSQSLPDLTAAELDRAWAVNVRACLLLVQAFAEQFVPGPGGGRVVLFTSGQHRGPMAGELPYVATKGALHQLTGSLADALADRGITVNALNPGPTDTGWASPETHAAVAGAMPGGRWNTAADAAGVVSLLISHAAATITGQVVDAEGGFRRDR